MYTYIISVSIVSLSLYIVVVQIPHYLNTTNKQCNKMCISCHTKDTNVMIKDDYYSNCNRENEECC